MAQGRSTRTISTIEWIRTRRLSIKYSDSVGQALEAAIEEYAAAKEIPQTVHSNIRSAAKALPVPFASRRHQIHTVENDR